MIKQSFIPSLSLSDIMSPIIIPLFLLLALLLPLFAGPFVERAIMASHTSEAVWFNSQDVLPKQAEEEQ